MGINYDPSKLYNSFLETGGQASLSGDLQQGLTNSLHQLAEIVASKEIIRDGTPWQARLHTFGPHDQDPEISGDPETIAENYLTHLGSVSFASHRLFELDRSLKFSPTSASNIRLEIEVPADTPRAQYNYTLTTYTPRTAPPEPPRKPFDYEEYQFMVALIADGKLEAWEAEQAALAANAPEATAPLPSIAHQDINSQFSFRPASTGEQRTTIYTHTFQPDSMNPAVAPTATPILAPQAQLEAAYAPGRLPQRTPSQDMLRQHRGPHALIHHHLALALRELISE